jgi:hypothetical protein
MYKIYARKIPEIARLRMVAQAEFDMTAVTSAQSMIGPTAEQPGY